MCTEVRSLGFIASFLKEVSTTCHCHLVKQQIFIQLPFFSHEGVQNTSTQSADRQHKWHILI